MKVNYRQQEIEEYFFHTDKSILVKAGPGTGKSTTMLYLAKKLGFLDKGIMLAFNNKIVKELKEKLVRDRISNVEATTLHSFGLKLVRQAGIRFKIDDNKYYQMYKIFSKDNSDIKLMSKKEENVIKFNLKFLDNFSRIFLTDDYKEIKKASIELGVWEIKEDKILKQYWEDSFLEIREEFNNRSYKIMDFTDMLYYPVLFNLKCTEGFTHVFADECLPGDTMIKTSNTSKVSLKSLKNKFDNGDPIYLPTFNEKRKHFEYDGVKNIWSNGVKDVHCVVLNGKRKLKSTVNHKFLTTKGWKRLDELEVGDNIRSDNSDKPYQTVSKSHVYHSTQEVFDIEMEFNHNFIVTSSSKNSKAGNYGIVAHNCQDFSVLQHKLFQIICEDMQHQKFIAVGDDRQAINAFAGSSAESFEFFKDYNNVIELPLDITYRCPPIITDELNKIYSGVVPFKKNGGSLTVKTENDLVNIPQKSLILCRNTAPLIQTSFKLAALNKKCYILGKDSLNTTKRILRDYMDYNIFKALMEANNELTKVSQDMNNEASRIRFYLLKDALDVVASLKNNFKFPIGTKLSSYFYKASELFTPTPESIVLSTIHKSKGLENDNVYLINKKTLMPSKMAIGEKAKIQEKNLFFVAMSRSSENFSYLNLKFEENE